MTEKEKGRAGLFYNPNYDPELTRDREVVKDKCFEYNNIPPSKREERKAKMREILGGTKGDFLIESPFNCDYGYNTFVGENFYANHNLVILDTARVTIGDNVFVAPNCGFYCAGHPLDKDERNEGIEYALPITIGSDVWIGGNVVILPGVTVGNNVVIGAGSVVTKDIPDGVIACGNPCRVLRAITEEDKGRFPSIAQRKKAYKIM